MRNSGLLFRCLLLSLFFIIGCEKEKEDSQPPEAIILSPSTSSKIRIDSTFTVRIEAIDNEEVKKVSLLIDGVEFRASMFAPFNFVVEKNTLSLGLHSIYAKAEDHAGNVGSSSVVDIEIVGKPRNILTGYIKNNLGTGIFKAMVRVRSQSKKSVEPSQELFFNSIAVEMSEVISQSDDRVGYFDVLIDNNYTIDIDTVYTNSEGKYEFFDLKEGEYDIEVLAGGYVSIIESVSQTEGEVVQDITLEMSSDIQVTNIVVADGSGKIEVKWDPVSVPTIKGYNVYESHYFMFSLEGTCDHDYIHPIYSQWKKVNSQPVEGESYEFQSEKYNGGYGVHILPVNQEGVESEFHDKTLIHYVKLPPLSIRHAIFGLSSDIHTVSIPNSTHEVCLHMEFIYDRYPFSNTEDRSWKVQLSEDKVAWTTIGELDVDEKQPPGYVLDSEYGYFISIPLNSYKGKTLFLRTSPEENLMSETEVYNIVKEYSMDGTDFQPIGFAPVAAFTANKTSITEGETIQFTDMSTNGPSSWSWDFGDGLTSTLQNPSHKYNQGGVKTVRLSVSNEFGVDSIVKENYIQIGSRPESGFIVDKVSVEVNEEIQFTDQSQNNAEAWKWDFGDGTSSEEQNPTKSFNYTGSYTVSQIVTNKFGSDTTICVDCIVVNPKSPWFLNFRASDIGITSFNLSCDIFDRSSGITESGFCWSTSPEPTIDHDFIVVISGEGDMEASLSDLQTGTRYYIRAYSRYSGLLAYSEEIEVDTRDMEIFNLSNSGLSSNSISSISIDGENIWIGTYGGGLNYFDGRNWTVFNMNNSDLPSNWVNKVVTDETHSVWAIVQLEEVNTFSLVRFDGVDWDVFNSSNTPMTTNNIHDIEVDLSNNMWIGTYEELLKYNNDEWTVYNETNSDIGVSNIMEIEIDQSNTVWLTAFNNGITQFDGVDWKTILPSSFGLSENRCYDIAIDESGNKWISAYNAKLYRYNDIVLTELNGDNSCVSLYPQGTLGIRAHESDIWYFGSRFLNGFTKFDQTDCERIEMSNSLLPSNDIRDIAFDVNGDLWIGTPEGLVHYYR